MCVFVIAAFAQAENINHGQENENCGHGDDAKCHPDAVAAHALLARLKITRLIGIVVTPAVSAAMRDFARASTAQLRFPFDLYTIANGRHNTNSDVISSCSSWLKCLA